MIKNCMKLFVYFDERRRQLGRLYSYMHADQNAYSIRIVGYLHDTVMKWNVFVFQRNTTIGKKQQVLTYNLQAVGYSILLNTEVEKDLQLRKF